MTIAVIDLTQVPLGGGLTRTALLGLALAVTLVLFLHEWIHHLRASRSWPGVEDVALVLGACAVIAGLGAV